MSPAERAFLRRFRERLRKLSRPLRARELAAHQVIRQSLTDAELLEALRTGSVERLIADIMSDARLDPQLVSLRNLVDQTVIQAAEAATRDLPRAIAPAIEFHRLSDRLIDAARALDTRVIQGIKEELRGSVRQRVEAGLLAGENPRATARGIREVVGLAPNQEAAVRNFERMLREGDAELFTRKLRDRRFDGTIRKAFSAGGLSEDQIVKMSDAYRRRYLAHNAETHARSAAIDAMRQANFTAMEEAIENGFVDEATVIKSRVTAGDDRVRDEHREIAEATRENPIGMRDEYPNGEVISGELSWNCRCRDWLRVDIAAIRVREPAPNMARVLVGA